MMIRKLKRNFNIGLAGFLASLVMFLFIYLGINVTGMAPFNVPPSAAFLFNLGVEGNGYALLLHFCYGILWSFVLTHSFEDEVSVSKAVALAIILWLFMMVVYSPLIGWGIFGFGYAHNLAPDHALFLESSVSYMVVTFLLHLIYGLTLGYLSSIWLTKQE